MNNSWREKLMGFGLLLLMGTKQLGMIIWDWLFIVEIRGSGRLSQKRVKTLIVLITAVFGALIFRAVVLHLFPIEEQTLQRLSQIQYSRNLTILPYRGTILDRNKNPLALSVNTLSLAINSMEFSPTISELKGIEEITKLPRAIIQAKIDMLKKRKSYFGWLARHIQTEDDASIERLKKIKGLHLVDEPSRFYPEDFLGSHLLGLVNFENKGVSGLEKALNHWLEGERISLPVIKDGRGKNMVLAPELTNLEAKSFQITLTIDKNIQEILENSLEKWGKASKATSAFGVVADPYTGKLLAVANFPRFNPNQRLDLKIQLTRNQVFSDIYEFGSIVKPLVVAKALEQKITQEQEVLNCEKNGFLSIDAKHKIHDDHPKEEMTTAEVLIYSSNICIYKLAKRMGKEGLFNTFHVFGFGEESFGLAKPLQNLLARMANWQSWPEIRFANMAFGQGFLASAVDIVRAYSAMANGGFLIQPRLIESVEESSSSHDKPEVFLTRNLTKEKKILSDDTSASMRRILYRVTTEGTGIPAQALSYTVAGKTGTAQKIDLETKKYSKDLRLATFAGFAPAFDPRIVVIIAINEPHQKPYYGGTWAAPSFSEVAEGVLKYLNVKPDKKIIETVAKTAVEEPNG